MRLIKCKRCGAEIIATGKEQCYCDACRAAIKAESVIRDRVCVECGCTFAGGPRAKYCPDCRMERRRKADIVYHSRESARKLGSTDLCARCGQEYIVRSGRQRYCPECSDEAVRDNINKHKRDYFHDHAEEYVERKRNLKQDRKVCVVCGKLFNAPVRVTCSDECAKIHKAELQRGYDAKRAPRQKQDK